MEYDFISKVCMASNFIHDGKDKEEYLWDARKDGSHCEDQEAEDAENIYKALSIVFTDNEIRAMATSLNNMNDDLESMLFEETYK